MKKILLLLMLMIWLWPQKAHAQETSPPFVIEWSEDWYWCEYQVDGICGVEVHEFDNYVGTYMYTTTGPGYYCYWYDVSEVSSYNEYGLDGEFLGSYVSGATDLGPTAYCGNTIATYRKRSPLWLSASLERRAR